ncbi:DUF7146 domain-containing protein [Tateyamaria pelophila]|uniref:DUF7146 domain-containing protein n=1 Tax=Tateyamaria pelophila TaxID=328415 RepID=UPI001CC05911|nr:hypothetical protein [Tateyamaria pelophila]
MQREIEDSARTAAAAEEKAAKIAWVQDEVEKMEALPGTPAEQYLLKERRLEGIDLEHDSLRYASEFRCRPEGRKSKALVAVVTDAGGKIVGMQGTLLQSNGRSKRDEKGKKTKLSAGYIGDGAVRIKNKLGTGTIAIAEGLETGLTRLLAGPAEIRVCLGSIRPETAQVKAGRVEVIADSDKAQECRQIARELAADNPHARVHVVTVPASLGEKADLNDLLQDMGSRAVAAAVDDADRVFARQRRANVEQLVRGSDEEIADRVLETQEDLFGRIVITEGTVWIFDGKLWTALNDNRLTRAIARFDGATYPTPSNGIGEVKITSSKAKSVEALLMSKREDDGFFDDAPTGITCDSGFIVFDHDADERRFKVLVFDNAYSEEQADEGLADRIIENEADLLLHLVVEAATGLLSTRRMADPATSGIAKEAWMKDADRVRAWSAERLSIRANSVVTVADLYLDFRQWCAAEGVSESRIPARNSFARRLRQVEPRLVPGPNSAGARFENAALKPVC